MTHRCKADNKPLRKALDAPDGLLISRHREYIERVRELYPHTVSYRDLINGGTCGTYALGLGDESAYWAIAHKFGRKIFAGSSFMEWLIESRLVEIDGPKEGCLALYFKDGDWQHVGIVTVGGRVISRWGEFPVYEHDVCDVPERYGDEVRYFQMPPPGVALRFFLEYAKTEGVSDTFLARTMKP